MDREAGHRAGRSAIAALGDGVDAPRRHLCAKVTVSNCHLKEASMEQVNTIGLDIAKHVFQAHGAGIAGDVLFRKRLTRAKLLGFFAAQARCVVAIEACAGSHYWAREISKLGHAVRLIPPAYVKPFVKRQKNDAADAEAICEAAQRPSMRFVPIKDEEQQANGVVFRARDLLVHQRTQCINALRGHLSEYGYVFPQGTTHVPILIAHVEDSNTSLPESARAILKILIKTFTALEVQIKQLDVEINRRAKEDAVARRLMTIPGVGPITATATIALVPAAEGFRTGRDFAAWLGLTPLQKSTGGKQKLGAVSKRGERTIRRLLILGASAVIRQACLRGAPAGSWLAQMLRRKPKMLVTVALANKMARVVWALLVKGGVYRAPVAAA
jgi:transposase